VNYCDLNWITQRIIISFIDIWDSAEHQTSSMIHQVECHSSISQDSNCCRDKWKTAFHMRYELYEWMMTSFELVNVSSTFQRYINWVLQNFLNEFCSVYVNDILIFTDESLHQHQIMYKEYYYDFEKLAYRLTLTNVSLKSSQSSTKVHSESWKEHTNEFSKDEDNHELTSF
jgi:hypothetical protein